MIHASQRLPAFVPAAIVVAGLSLIVLLIVLVSLGRAPGVEATVSPEADPLARAVQVFRGWSERERARSEVDGPSTGALHEGGRRTLRGAAASDGRRRD